MSMVATERGNDDDGAAVTNQTDFASAADAHFAFLRSEFGFEALPDDVKPSSGSSREYCSSHCLLSVIRSGSQVYVELCAPSAPGQAKMRVDLFELLEVKAPGEGFAYRFDPDAFAADPMAYRDAELGRLAGLVRDYCSDVLRGDFSVLDRLADRRRTRYAAVFEHSHD